MNVLISWLLSFMVVVAPPTRTQFYTAAKETPQEAEDRYKSIAADIMDVVYNPNIPPLFGGPDGRARSAAIVMSIMLHEGGFRRDVDYGLGTAGLGDGGQSYCLMQIKLGKGKTNTYNRKHNRFFLWNDDPADRVEGWTGPELVKDRKKCIEAGYRIIRSSFASCHSLTMPHWLTVYASGSCTTEGDAARKSATRMNVALNWFNTHQPVGFHDVDILAALRPPPTPAPSPLPHL